jgi:hypothetical protein
LVFSDPKPTVPLGVVSGDTIDLFLQRSCAICLKGVVKMWGSKVPVDSLETNSDKRVVLQLIAPDFDHEASRAKVIYYG